MAPNLECRLYEARYPEVDSAVMIRVTKVAAVGVCVSLLEFNNIEGVLPLSELSRRRIRNVSSLIKVGRVEPVIVSRVDKESGLIELSRTRISEEEKAACEERYSKKSKLVHSIMRHVAQTLRIDLEELYVDIAWPLYRKYGHAFEAFKVICTDPDTVLDALTCEVKETGPDGQEVTKVVPAVSEEVKDALVKSIRRRMTPPPLKIRAVIEMACDGDLHIKDAMRKAEAAGNNDCPVKIKSVAPPVYVLATQTLDKDQGITVLKNANIDCRKAIEHHKGKLLVKEEPRAVSEKDDKLHMTKLPLPEKTPTPKLPLLSSAPTQPNRAAVSRASCESRPTLVPLLEKFSSGQPKQKPASASSVTLDLARLTMTEKKPVEVEEPFIPLKDEEKAEVRRAFADANRTKVFGTYKNIQITGKVLQCLKPHTYLNDEVINVYLGLLKEREERDPNKFLMCHFFNTFFYKKLLQSVRTIDGVEIYDYKAVRRWTTQNKLGYSLIDCEKIFVPIHLGYHWCLAVINKADQKFQYLDSLGGRDDTRAMKHLASYYANEVKESGKDIDVSSWKHERVDDLPKQENGSDCGVFMIKYIDFYSRGMDLCFHQKDMPYFQSRTAKEVLQLRAD